MTTDLRYLAYTAMLTAALWIPYIVCQVRTNGPLKPTNYIDPALPRPVPAWGQRAHRTYLNAVEVFAPFAALVVVAQLPEGEHDDRVLGRQLLLAEAGARHRLLGRDSLPSNAPVHAGIHCRGGDFLASDQVVFENRSSGIMIAPRARRPSDGATARYGRGAINASRRFWRRRC